VVEKAESLTSTREISGLADEEPAGGNSPDRGFRDFVDFISSVDDEAAPPLAAQPGRHVPQRPYIRTRDRLARLDLHADDALLRFQKQINFEARTGSVEVELACPLNRFHPLEEFADNESLI